MARHRFFIATVWGLGAVALAATMAPAEDGAEKSAERQFLSNVRQVTSGFEKAGEGYFSPDAREIVYQAVPSGFPFYQIYVQELAGGEPRRLSTGRGRTTCAYYSPDGRRIMFASSHLDPQVQKTEDYARLEQQREREEAKKTGKHPRYKWDFDPYMDIFVLDRDGKNLRQLTNSPGYDAEGAFSPDGKQIAFCSDRDGDPDIYVMDADGANVRQLTNAPGYDGGPFISPDGRWVVFRSDRIEREKLQLHAVSIDGKQDVALTDNNGVNWAPFWHPTAPYIIWAGADHSNPKVRPNYDLWLMKYSVGPEGIARGPIVRVTDHAAADLLPVFTPDGKRLMWTSSRTMDRSSQLWIADFQLPKESE